MSGVVVAREFFNSENINDFYKVFYIYSFFYSSLYAVLLHSFSISIKNDLASINQLLRIDKLFTVILIASILVFYLIFKNEENLFIMTASVVFCLSLLPAVKTLLGISILLNKQKYILVTALNFAQPFSTILFSIILGDSFGVLVLPYAYLASSVIVYLLIKAFTSTEYNKFIMNELRSCSNNRISFAFINSEMESIIRSFISILPLVLFPAIFIYNAAFVVENSIMYYTIPLSFGSVIITIVSYGKTLESLVEVDKFSMITGFKMLVASLILVVSCLLFLHLFFEDIYRENLPDDLIWVYAGMLSTSIPISIYNILKVKLIENNLLRYSLVPNIIAIVCIAILMLYVDNINYLVILYIFSYPLLLLQFLKGRFELIFKGKYNV